jgi:hypothetical protein
MGATYATVLRSVPAESIFGLALLALRSFSAMHPADGKSEPSEIDPEKLSKLLEIELLQKRATWQRAAAQRRTFRTFAFLFLLIVIGGAVAAYFFFVGGGQR